VFPISGKAPTSAVNLTTNISAKQGERNSGS
jgi:hypothetical protein